MIDANTGSAVGDDGIIIGTIDGGNTWFEQLPQTGIVLWSVDFADANIGYAVGGGTANQIERVEKTIDGGNTWTPQSTGTNIELRSVDFVDANIGYAVGHQGIILKTTNGGNTWTPQTSGIDGILLSVAFVDANTGFAVGSIVTQQLGEIGILLGTTDGGNTWTPQSSGTNMVLLSVEFADANTVYISGAVGTILKASLPLQKIPVGGELLPIETTSLLLASAQSFSWMIPVILSGIGIGLFVVSRKSKNS